VSKLSKIPLSIRFEEFQLDEAEKYIQEHSSIINFSELVRLALSVYLRNKMMNKKENNEWSGF
jgi:hypothetical protein